MLSSNFSSLAKDFKKDLKREADKLKRAVPSGVAKGSNDLHRKITKDTVASGLPAKMAKTWRKKIYQNKGLNAAGLIWSKAPSIMLAAMEGAVIRPNKSKYLVIPLEYAVNMNFHRGRRMTSRGRRMAKFSDIAKAERRFGRLVPVPHPDGGGKLLLFANGVKVNGGKLRKARSRKGKNDRRKWLEKPESVALFLLVPDVRWRKRIDPARDARLMSARIVNYIDAGMGSD